MKNNWQQLKIDEVCDVLTGGTPQRTRKEYWEGDIRWMTSGEINLGEVYEVGGRITRQGLNNSNAKVLRKGTVLVALNGQGATRGKTAILRVETTCNQSLAGVIPKNGFQIWPDYLWRNFQYRYKEIRNLRGGEFRSGLNLSLIRSIFVSFPIKNGNPNLKEQKRIATKIDKLFTEIDKGIEKTKKALADSRNLLPSELDTIFSKVSGDNWEYSVLGSLVEVFDRKRVPLNKGQREKIKGNIPYLGANGIVDYINDYIFDGDYLLIAEDGGYFKKFEKSCYLFSGKFWANNHAHIVKAELGKTSNEWLYYFLIYEDVEKYCSGATRLKLNQQRLKSIQTPIPLKNGKPDLQKQKKIIKKLDKIQEQSQKLQIKYKEQLKNFELLRQSILNQAFQGKL